MKPMRRYSPNDLPVTCADCGGKLRYDRTRYAWAHVDRALGLDHAPHVAGMVRR